MSSPLSGIRILDLTLIMAGPYCTLILGDLGAEVIKIEKPGIGESSREMPPYFFEDQSAYFIAMNRNKKSMTLDLKSGIMSYTGEPGQMPVRMGAPMGDLGGGLFASQGILAALYQREKTGRGQQIDISLVDCQTSLLTYRAQFYLVGGEIARPVGSGHVSAHSIRAFKTKTFAIVIDANTENIFAELCQAIGKPDMINDPKFNSRETRLKNKEELYSILESVTRLSK